MKKIAENLSQEDKKKLLGMRRKRIPSPPKEQLIEAYRKLRSMQELTKKYNVSSSTISKWFKEKRIRIPQDII